MRQTRGDLESGAMRVAHDVLAVRGEYLALAQVTRTFRDRYRIQPFGGVHGRPTIDVPPGTPRGDMISYRAGVSSTADVGDRDTFGAAVNGERLGMAGLLCRIGRWCRRGAILRPGRRLKYK